MIITTTIIIAIIRMRKTFKHRNKSEESNKFL
jgi:hypothetical protein